MSDPRAVRIWLAEDNPGDVFLVRSAIQAQHLLADLIVMKDGQEALARLEAIEYGKEECPDLVLLDLNLPKYTGSAVLERMRSSSRLAELPVVIVTSSDAPRDRELATRFRASSYFRKPNDFDEFMRLGDIVRGLLEFRHLARYQ